VKNAKPRPTAYERVKRAALEGRGCHLTFEECHALYERAIMAGEGEKCPMCGAVPPAESAETERGGDDDGTGNQNPVV
jgi:hypothetical protein